MNFWLMKSEPDAYSWAQMCADVKTDWSGVRNYQAAGNMKKMALGDLCFFYHSNQGREIVGIVKVTRLYHPDPTDQTGRFGQVEVKAHAELKVPVTLAALKAHPVLKEMAFVRQSRLSVAPVLEKEWQLVLELGQGAKSISAKRR